jgi:hypothetical protein
MIICINPRTRSTQSRFRRSVAWRPQGTWSTMMITNTLGPILFPFSSVPSESRPISSLLYYGDRPVCPTSVVGLRLDGSAKSAGRLEREKCRALFYYRRMSCSNAQVLFPSMVSRRERTTLLCCCIHKHHLKSVDQSITLSLDLSILLLLLLLVFVFVSNYKQHEILFSCCFQ